MNASLFSTGFRGAYRNSDKGAGSGGGGFGDLAVNRNSLDFNINDLLRSAVKVGASDVYILPNSPVKFKIDDKNVLASKGNVASDAVLLPHEAQELAYQLLPSKDQIATFEMTGDIDVPFAIREDPDNDKSPTRGFRVNIAKTRTGVTATYGCLNLMPPN
jgi:Tfp pilus assembly pilus retraction ATPase PilT